MGGYDEYVSKEDVDRFLSFLKKRRKKEEVEIIEEVVEELEDSVFSEAVQEVIIESKAVKPQIGVQKPVVDYQKLLQDIEAMLPAEVTVTGVPTTPVLAGGRVEGLEATLMPLDFDKARYEAFCLGQTPPMGDPAYCERFAFQDALVPEQGDELAIRFTAFAGIRVVVVEIPIIDWGIDVDADVPEMCSYVLAWGNPDDVAAVRGIYEAGPTTTAISGTVAQGGSPDPLRFQGAEVILRKTDDPLGTAYSAISGGTFFPCNPGGACYPNCDTTPCDPGNPAAKGAYAVEWITAGDYKVCLRQLDTRFSLANENFIF